ncbi:hypothetical protein TTHERM_00494590 (macronuclear) [Tetrahymena thermophila SB210]|uniref:Uncharacterized protein n=1 Tax=Tetrahymena thermophila (strain SB210) TaxID=312017 RepID=I7M3E6_TETTS|nr:hypothetical protein TTHERM_00494590 [Tetrahymena thermophila SB210]EAS02998.2 hypothetical protein TTHERM_00494590 [Tetrahymena thermophila SB210]|eukprot:XP_001023243.2 hypothetical protein TTHERM_00494590 [Tetrahymena thermophila SB210]
MNQKNFRIQGFLQNKLISETSLDQLRQFQVQDQSNFYQKSVLLQQKEQSRDNILNKVKVIYNRPKFEIDYNLCLLSYQVNKFPDTDLTIEQQIAKKQEQRKKTYDEKIILAQTLQNLPSENVEFQNQKDQANQPYLLKIKSNPNENNLPNLYSNFKEERQNIPLSSSYFNNFNNQSVNDIVKFSKETGCDYPTSKKYIDENGNYEQAIKKYQDYIQQQFQQI